MYKDDACCAECVEDWLWAEEEEYSDVKPGSDLTLQCMCVVKPNTVTWSYSGDGGENWTDVEEGKKGLQLKLKKVSADDNGTMCLLLDANIIRAVDFINLLLFIL